MACSKHLSRSRRKWAYNSCVMNKLLLAVALIALTLPSLCTAQKLPQPILNYSRLPQYPPTAVAARVEGKVRLSFVLNERGDVAEVHPVSGPVPLADAAIEDVRTWRFSLPHDLFRTEWRYETEFVYRFSGNEVDPNTTPKLTVSLDSFQHVEVVSDAVKPSRIVDYRAK
jgi:TonB family protein